MILYVSKHSLGENTRFGLISRDMNQTWRLDLQTFNVNISEHSNADPMQTDIYALQVGGLKDEYHPQVKVFCSWIQ